MGSRHRPGRSWPLWSYFALLFALLVLGAVAGAIWVDREAIRDARTEAVSDALFTARAASRELGEQVAQVKAAAAELAANPQIAQVLEKPRGCTLTFRGIGGGPKDHLDVLRPDGTVACSSRPVAPGTRYTGAWVRRALEKPLLLAPQRDPRTGAQASLATAPIPGGKGIVVAFSDLAALGADLASRYDDALPQRFLVTSRDDRTVISRSGRATRWIGVRLPPGRLDLRLGAEQPDFDGTTRLYARARVPGAGWNVYVGEEKAAALHSAAHLRARQLKVFGAGVLIFFLAAVFVYAKVVAPIRRLAEAVRGAAALERPVPVDATGPAEVRTLAANVNSLTEAVHEELRERRRAEAAAQASEESYRLLFESNPSPMYVYDVESLRFVAVNDAALVAYGYSRDEFVGMPVDEIVAPDELDRLRRTVGEIRTGRGGGLKHTGVWRHRRRDGSELDVEITGNDHDFEGRPARVVLALDVTERVEAERRLRESEARYRDLFENATDLIASADLDGRLADVNAAFARAVGYSREELLQMRIDDLSPEDQRHRIADARSRKLAGDEEASVYEQELVARDGRRIQLEVASRLILEDGQPVGTEAICRDITERKNLEEQLRQAQRLEAIGRLAGGVAHDFNNLLTVIGGYAESLLDGRDRASEPELDQIARAAERAALLTRQLLAFSRRQVLQPRVLNVNEVVDGLTPMLRRLIGADVELVASLEPELGPVLADPGQLEQIVLNLAVNARDAMPDGGTLTIRTANVELDEDYVAHDGEAKAGPHVLLSVGDTGTGMDDETLAHVFEPFFTTKPLGTGTGLGLATVYGIVKQSGGSIWVYSEPGAGTTFKICLPRETAAVAEQDAPARHVPAVANGTETILVAEDEESLRRLATRILEKYGYEVVAAESATEALRIVEANGRRFDLLLTDLIMPELSGAALAQRVSELVPGIRVLFMSGYADDVVTKNGALEPGAPFLEKPFTASDLAAKVRELLDRPR